jgi:hypothetical protein
VTVYPERTLFLEKSPAAEEIQSERHIHLTEIQSEGNTVWGKSGLREIQFGGNPV